MKLDLDRLCKLLGMLGSRHEGEVVNAARLSSRMLQEAGLTWLGLIGSLETIAKLTEENERLRRRLGVFQTVDDDAADDHRADAGDLLARHERGQLSLNAWEIEFLTSIEARYDELSEKQEAVLARIKRKAGI